MEGASNGTEPTTHTRRCHTPVSHTALTRQVSVNSMEYHNLAQRAHTLAIQETGDDGSAPATKHAHRVWQMLSSEDESETTRSLKGTSWTVERSTIELQCYQASVEKGAIFDTNDLMGAFYRRQHFYNRLLLHDHNEHCSWTSGELAPTLQWFKIVVTVMQCNSLGSAHCANALLQVFMPVAESESELYPRKFDDVLVVARMDLHTLTFVALVSQAIFAISTIICREDTSNVDPYWLYESFPHTDALCLNTSEMNKLNKACYDKLFPVGKRLLNYHPAEYKEAQEIALHCVINWMASRKCARTQAAGPSDHNILKSDFCAYLREALRGEALFQCHESWSDFKNRPLNPKCSKKLYIPDYVYQFLEYACDIAITRQPLNSGPNDTLLAYIDEFALTTCLLSFQEFAHNVGVGGDANTGIEICKLLDPCELSSAVRIVFDPSLDHPEHKLKGRHTCMQGAVMDSLVSSAYFAQARSYVYNFCNRDDVLASAHPISTHLVAARSAFFELIGVDAKETLRRMCRDSYDAFTIQFPSHVTNILFTSKASCDREANSNWHIFNNINWNIFSNAEYERRGFENTAAHRELLVFVLLRSISRCNEELNKVLRVHRPEHWLTSDPASAVLSIPSIEDKISILGMNCFPFKLQALHSRQNSERFTFVGSCTSLVNGYMSEIPYEVYDRLIDAITSVQFVQTLYDIGGRAREHVLHCVIEITAKPSRFILCAKGTATDAIVTQCAHAHSSEFAHLIGHPSCANVHRFTTFVVQSWLRLLQETAVEANASELLREEEELKQWLEDTEARAAAHREAKSRKKAAQKATKESAAQQMVKEAAELEEKRRVIEQQKAAADFEVKLQRAIDRIDDEWDTSKPQFDPLKRIGTVLGQIQKQFGNFSAFQCEALQLLVVRARELRDQKKGKGRRSRKRSRGRHHRRHRRLHGHRHRHRLHQCRRRRRRKRRRSKSRRIQRLRLPRLPRLPRLFHRPQHPSHQILLCARLHARFLTTLSLCQADTPTNARPSCSGSKPETAPTLAPETNLRISSSHPTTLPVHPPRSGRRRMGFK